jgi:hypothetical protein
MLSHPDYVFYYTQNEVTCVGKATGDLYQCMQGNSFENAICFCFSGLQSSYGSDQHNVGVEAQPRAGKLDWPNYQGFLFSFFFSRRGFFASRKRGNRM